MTFWTWLSHPSPRRDSPKAWIVRLVMIAIIVAIIMLLRRL